MSDLIEANWKDETAVSEKKKKSQRRKEKKNDGKHETTQTKRTIKWKTTINLNKR